MSEIQNVREKKMLGKKHRWMLMFLVILLGICISLIGLRISDRTSDCRLHELAQEIDTLQQKVDQLNLKIDQHKKNQ